MPKNNIYRALTSFNASQIQGLFQTARKVTTNQFFELRRSAHPISQAHGHFLIIIPRRVANAPIRNKLRRQIKHIIFQDQLYQHSFDWIIIVRAPAKNLTFAQIKSFFNSWCTAL